MRLVREFLRGFLTAAALQSKPRPRANPTGSKLLRRWFKHKHGRRGTYAEAYHWYAERVL